MKKNFAFGLLLLPLFIFSQKISSSKWQDLFSYNNVLSIRQDGDRLIAATENGLFYYSPTSGEITKLSKANGLHEVKISAFDYNSETHTGLVGYESGAMDVITPDGITYIVDVPISGGYQGDKRINHISITGDQAVVSVGYPQVKTATVYALAIFNFDKKEFGQSVIMNEPSKEAVIKGDEVYTVTNSGVRSHKIDNTFEIDNTFAIYPGDWQQIPGTFSNIAIEKDLMAYASGSIVYYGSNQASVGGTVKNITISDQNIAVTYDANGKSAVTIINTNETQQFSENLNTAFYTNGRIYAGSQFSGILATSPGYSFPQNPANIKSYKPDGPYNNRSYKLTLLDNKIWVSTGSRTDRYNKPDIDKRNLGFYFFDGSKWVYPGYLKNFPTALNVLDVVPNPSDINQIFFTNYTMREGQGIYRLKYDSQAVNYVEEKYEAIQPGNFGLNRPVGLTFDDKNNLFATIAFANPEGGGKNPSYASFASSFNTISSKFINTFAAAQKPIYYEGLLWIPNPRATNGEFVAIDLKNTPQNLSDDTSYLINTSNNMPANAQSALSIAFDKNGDAWMGTDTGLRVLANANSAVKDNPKAEPIIITQNGVGEELFRDTAILQVEVDSGNQKWVSAQGGGVYYLSPDGQTTHLHFTKENSPLPNNNVTDIKVDPKTGKVYFATTDGIVTYQSDVTNVSENFAQVLVYPNPVVYANYKGNVHIKGLAEKTNIRIADAAGNLVHQAVARGGFYDWDLTNKGKRVASGIYFVLMTNADGTDKATAKIAVVN